nr:hypothetical protein [Vagococcus hydrophili]
MIYYLWVFILSSIAIISVFFFLLTFNRDLSFCRKLKKDKKQLILNFSLLFISMISTGLIIYLFMILKKQIEIFS